MGFLPVWFGGFGFLCASSCAFVNDEVMCFQGDRGSKGTCGSDGPKGDKVGLGQTNKILFCRRKRR